MGNTRSKTSSDLAASVLDDLAPGLLAKGDFFVTSENGTGPLAFIQMMKDYYTDLAGAYDAKGMMLEARVFAEVAEDFKNLEEKFIRATKRLTKK